MARTGQGPIAVLVMPGLGYMDYLRSSPSLPLSLLQAAAIAATRHDLALVDLRLHRDWRQALRDAVGPATRLVAVTAFTGRMILSALEVARFARNELKLKVAWGGIHATVEPQSTVLDPDLDYVIVGEGEFPFAALLDALAAGSEVPADVPGLWTLRDGTVSGLPPEPIADLDSLPDVPYELVDPAAYMPLYGGRKSFFFHTSRGCPRACRYCYNRVVNRGVWRAQSAERVIERLDHAWKVFGFEDVYVLDDSFLVDLDRARRIAQWFAQRPVTWQWQGIEVHDILRLSDEDISAFVDSGLQRVTVGVESGSDRVRKILGKPGKAEHVRQAALRMRPHDLRVFCSFMAGIPGETDEDLRATIRMHRELPTINPNVRTSPIYNFCPYPGTPLFDAAVAGGFEPPKRLQDWASLNFEDGQATGMSSHPESFWQSLHFASLFCDVKATEYSSSVLVRALASMYRPIARWRLDHLEFRAMPETRIARWIEGLLSGRVAPVSAKVAPGNPGEPCP
jgi:radical SAM superfamily enzyme YgiQ (UPF0313 family)